MEKETLLVIQKTLTKKIKAPMKIFSKRTLYDQKSNPLMEWDRILIYKDRIFLYEAKHLIFNFI